MRANDFSCGAAYPLVPAHSGSAAYRADIYLYIQCGNDYAQPLEGLHKVCCMVILYQHHTLPYLRFCAGERCKLLQLPTLHHRGINGCGYNIRLSSKYPHSLLPDSALLCLGNMPSDIRPGVPPPQAASAEPYPYIPRTGR